MPTWPKDVDECKNCGSSAERRSHGGRGYCFRCYYFIRRREVAEKWIYKDIQSLGRFISDPYATNLMRYSEEDFSEFKQTYVAWLKRQIRILKGREESRNGQLEALDLEYKFGEVLKLLNRKARWPQNASFLAHYFNKQQMAVIYSQLDNLIEMSVKNSDDEGFFAGFDAVHRRHTLRV